MCKKIVKFEIWLMEVANRHSIINKNWFHIDPQVKLNKEAGKCCFSVLKMLKNVISELKIFPLPLMMHGAVTSMWFLRPRQTE